MRALRFCVVGAMGAAVQLLALAVLNRIWPGHYLYATGLALELTVLHNFWWHVRYTWRDRMPGASWPGAMVRFQMANGLVSLLGNLVLMRALVQGAGMPVVAAYALAIACCSVVNFSLGDGWAFRARC